MERVKIKTHWLVLIGYLLGVMVTGLFRGSLVLQRDWLNMIGLILGGGFGWALMWLERLVYVYWSHSDTQVAQYAKYQFDKKAWKAGWQLLEQRKGEMEELTFRSALFQAAWVVLALFALTSTAGLFGKALVMGLGLHILLDEWRDYLQNKALLKRWLFWQVKREISDSEVKWYLYGVTGIFLWLTLLLV